MLSMAKTLLIQENDPICIKLPGNEPQPRACVFAYWQSKLMRVARGAVNKARAAQC